MLILDTDHLSELDRATSAGQILLTRLSQASMDVGTTIVSIEEQLRGRFAQLGRARDPHKMIVIYHAIQATLEGIPRWIVLPWSSAAASAFEALRDSRLGIGTMDLRIASIVLTDGSKLLTRNLRDFQRIPNLDVENWLE